MDGNKTRVLGYPMERQNVLNINNLKITRIAALLPVEIKCISMNPKNITDINVVISLELIMYLDSFSLKNNTEPAMIK